MSGPLFCGIDPGLSGALAILDGDGALVSVFPMPTRLHGKGFRVDAGHLRQILTKHGPITLCLLEQVASRPGQGVASAFTFGRGYGALEGAIGALGVPLDYVTPSVWKRAYSLTSNKQDSIRKACDLFPQLAEWRDGKGPPDGIAEAVLLAELARRRWSGGGA